MTPLGIVLHLVACVSINLVVIGTSRYHWNFAISRVLGDPSYLLDYSDSDAGWNSTQHPTWPQALGEEFTPDVKDLWMGLRCLCIYIHIHIDIEEHTWICWMRNHSLGSGRMTEFYVHGITGWCWVESFQTQRGCWVEIWGMLGGNCMRK